MIYKIKELNLFKKSYKNSKTKKEFHILKTVVNGIYYTVGNDKEAEIDVNELQTPICLVNARVHVTCKEADGYKNYNMYVISFEATKEYVEEEADIETAFPRKAVTTEEVGDESKLPF